jgi:hypothetical protein
LAHKGLPSDSRPRIWLFLVHDSLRLNRAFFETLFLRTISDQSNLNITVKTDLRRLFGFARDLPHFMKALLECEVVLNMLTVP